MAVSFWRNNLDNWQKLEISNDDLSISVIMMADCRNIDITTSDAEYIGSFMANYIGASVGSTMLN